MNLLKSLSKPQLRQLSNSAVRRNRLKPDYGPMIVQRSFLLNGIRVAAVKPLGTAISACTVLWQAGSRNEYDDQLGASHFIRACSTASGCGYSSFAKMRMLQQHGVSVTCSSDRQTVAYTMRCPLPTFSELKYYLVDIAARCCYNPWEIDDRRRLIHDDLVRLSPSERVMDLVQTASWSGPLANSNYCAKRRIDDMSEDSLNCYAFTNCRTDELVVTSVGIPFEETINVAELLECRVHRCKTIWYDPEQKTIVLCFDFTRKEEAQRNFTARPEPRFDMLSYPRSGFEYYDLGPGSDTWIAVAVPGCGTTDLTCLLKHAILAAACGTTDVQMGLHSMDRTLMPPLGAMAGGDVHTHYRAFNISYRDAGIFGILAKTRACSAWKVALAASEFLSHVGDLNFSQIEIGKARLKVDLARHYEDCVRESEGTALEMANGAHVNGVRHMLQLVDLVPNDELSCTAKILSSRSCNMSYAVVGDVGAVPHNMELQR